MVNLQGPNRFDRHVTQSRDVWTLNNPSRVRLIAEGESYHSSSRICLSPRADPANVESEAFGKSMFCASVIQNTLRDCRLGTVQRARDSLAYFFCVTYKPYLEDPPVQLNDFNIFLRTVISQLSPPGVVFAPLRTLWMECTRYHPARLPTNMELQTVLMQILWQLDKPIAPGKGDPVTPGETYLVLDELDLLDSNMRDDYTRFIKLVASQQFKHFHLLISATNPLTVGIDPPWRLMEREDRERKEKARTVRNVSGAAPSNPEPNATKWEEIVLDATTTKMALSEWIEDRFLNDYSLANLVNIRQDVMSYLESCDEK